MALQRRKSHRKQYSTLLLFLLIALAFGVVGLFWQGAVWFRNYSGKNDTYDLYILDSARRNQVDPRLIKAVIWRESKFNPKAVGKAGEIGLMQIMQDRSVADWAKAHNRQIPAKGALFHPALNIEIGSWYLARAVKRWSRYKDCHALALAEYNAGLTRTNRWKPADPNGNVCANISISSTLSYVNVILDKYEKYKTDWKIK
jgi:soluble lytic murein transglycosylase